MLRSHTCGELREEHSGQDVTLGGWVLSIREHSSVTFLVLRDQYGTSQVVLEATSDVKGDITRECVVLVSGNVRRRPQGTEKVDEPTGFVEVAAARVLVVGPSEPPPLDLRDGATLSEQVRLQYRYLDLRRPAMLARLLARHKVVIAVRKSLEENGFVEVELPMFVKPTPEGSRDFIVPSRHFPGRAYALPQSPQLYKQTLMVAGVDRYYSLPRCFRDEDPRRGRQLVHTQIDLEMSFAEEDDVFKVVEDFVCAAFGVQQIELERPFPRYTYAEVMRRWGLDKPDLRFGMELLDLTEQTRAVGSPLVDRVLETGGIVKGIVAPGCADYSRAKKDEFGTFLKPYGISHLLWLSRDGDSFKSSFGSSVDVSRLSAIANAASLQEGDLLLMVADHPSRVARGLGELRNLLGGRLKLIPSGVQKPLWVTDFPMFEYDEQAKQWAPMHHMFTKPKEEYLETMEDDPGSVIAHLYDVVLNGVELGSGSIRITNPDLQRRVMDLVGYAKEKAMDNFGFFLEAYTRGAPPHAGIALGLDNLVMTTLGLTNLQDVIAFPNNSSGVFPLDGSPAAVDEQALLDCGLRLVPRE